MNSKFFSVMYAVNIISQAIFSLLTPVALMFGVSWLFIHKLSAPEWLYAVLIPIGVLFGLVSMVRFVLTATANLERLEKQNQNKRKTGHTKDGK